MAGCRAVDVFLWRRLRRHCLPGAPELLSNVAPAGVGNGANVTALPRGRRGTLRGASAGVPLGLVLVVLWRPWLDPPSVMDPWGVGLVALDWVLGRVAGLGDWRRR